MDKEIHITGVLVDMLMGPLISAQAVNVSPNWIWMKVKTSCTNVLEVLQRADALIFFLGKTVMPDSHP